MTTDELVIVVTNFRTAIENVVYSGRARGNLILNFPKGCCSLASDMLQRFLHERGVETLNVCGSCGDDSHAWLETYDGIVIDITGDQYKYRTGRMCFREAVYVGEMDKFHEQFSKCSSKISYSDDFFDSQQGHFFRDKNANYLEIVREISRLDV